MLALAWTSVQAGMLMVVSLVLQLVSLSIFTPVSAVSQPVRSKGLRTLETGDPAEFHPLISDCWVTLAKLRALGHTAPPCALHLLTSSSPSQQEWDDPCCCSFRLLLFDIFQHLLNVMKDPRLSSWSHCAYKTRLSGQFPSGSKLSFFTM